MNRLVFAVWMFGFVPNLAVAQHWQVIPNWVDPFTQHETTLAKTTNTEGFTVGFYRDMDQTVRIYFSVPEASNLSLLSCCMVVLFKPKEGRGGDIKLPDTLSPEETGRANRYEATDLIWHGGDDTPVAGTLRNILNTEVLVARFFTMDQNTKQIDTIWSMESSHPAIEEALGIVAFIDPQEQAWHELKIAVAIAGMNRCTPSNHLSCTPIFDHCYSSFEVHRNVSEFNSCMAVIDN